ncbi:hypothetical protein BGZ63DRAFT_396666 [Mariannaea sp. PMI_226]|nr:hypothetical protein BGZ63DRAFT_396666 [Mariannaea sp. PMI_226]
MSKDPESRSRPLIPSVSVSLKFESFRQTEKNEYMGLILEKNSKAGLFVAADLCPRNGIGHRFKFDPILQGSIIEGSDYAEGTDGLALASDVKIFNVEKPNRLLNCCHWIDFERKHAASSKSILSSGYIFVFSSIHHLHYSSLITFSPRSYLSLSGTST